jgi:hypothetical protein
MRHPSNGRLRNQVDLIRQRFLQERGLPLADPLTAGCLDEALREFQATWNDRVYTPLATLWVFLGQVLNANRSVPRSPARSWPEGVMVRRRGLKESG